jgi:hypothetical protein
MEGGDMTQVKKESDLYPDVRKWLIKNHLCFETDIDTGLGDNSRIDVIGVTDVGGDLSGEVETIAVEVKREGTEPFTKASGQALAYKVYANRTYLAVSREKPFTPDEIHIASHLGIGLIQIQNHKCKEIMSSPYYKPMGKFNLLLLEKLALGKCQLCGYFFKIGNKEKNSYSKTSKNLEKAIKDKKGFRFWNTEIDERKRKCGNISIRRSESDFTYERRFLCPDCISNLFSPFKLKG